MTSRLTPKARWLLCLIAAVLGATAGYGESDTVILAGVCGQAPTDIVFTWASARKLLHIS